MNEDDLDRNRRHFLTVATVVTGAAGAVEALLCVRALETGLLPPTINLDAPDPDCALDHVSGKARPVAAQVALSNSFGFGGTNGALLLGRAGGAS